MDWIDSPEQAAFRVQVKELIDTRLPDRYQELARQGGLPVRVGECDRRSDDPAKREAAMDWAGALSERC